MKEINMKKTMIIALMLVFTSFQASAVELKEGSVYCVSSKKIIAYYGFLEKGRDNFAKKLMDRSDCYVKVKSEEAILQSEQKKYVELELISGFTIWTKKENIIR